MKVVVIFVVPAMMIFLSSLSFSSYIDLSKNGMLNYNHVTLKKTIINLKKIKENNISILVTTAIISAFACFILSLRYSDINFLKALIPINLGLFLLVKIAYITDQADIIESGKPNDIVWHKLRKSIIFTIIIYISFFIIFRLIYFIGLDRFWIKSSPFIGLFFIPFAFISNGGLFFIKHFITRIYTSLIKKSTPWNYISFLDYADSIIILQRIGGKYIFIHQSIIDFLIKYR